MAHIPRIPEVMIEESVAISTRVAPSFLRVGQLELFGRRARKNEHPKAMEELEMIMLHLIDREYSDVIDKNLTTEEKVVLLVERFEVDSRHLWQIGFALVIAKETLMVTTVQQEVLH